MANPPGSSQTGDSSESAYSEARSTQLTRLRRVLGRQEVTLIAVIVLITVIAGLRNPIFATSDNFIEIARAATVYFIVACPMTLIIIGGGLDFSAGSMFTLGGVTAALAMSEGVPWPLGIILGLLAGAIAGLVNALIIQRLDVPPIITTLGTFYFIAGGVVLMTGGADVTPLPEYFGVVGNGTLLGLPFVIWYGIVVGVVYWTILEKTRFGYAVRAVGGNRLAAVENGVNAQRVERWLYVGAGGVAALAGIIYTARTGAGQVSAGGAAVTLTVISAVLIGGTSLFGGLGNITGTALGAILFAQIDNALALSGIDAQYGSMIIGSILVLAVAADAYRRKQVFKAPRQS
jgi:ribose transport system permease protein